MNYAVQSTSAVLLAFETSHTNEASDALLGTVRFSIHLNRIVCI